MNTEWNEFYKQEQAKPYFSELFTRVKAAYKTSTVYPQAENIFNAYKLCGFNDCKVVIIGQDPYHGYNQANGLCFSVSSGVAAPPSLVNIFKELQTDLGINRTETDLSSWAKQGMLLLNRVLTVKAGTAYSHNELGWQEFTLNTVRYINQKERPVVFVLWGRKAQELKSSIDTAVHFIVESEHPSPLSASRGFFGSKPFSRINDYLSGTGQEPIDFSK